jgi:NDP-mannose synthase
MGDIGECNDRARPHAVILAGGKGVRLRPYTTALPKPLVPLGDECPILEVVLRQLARAGFRSASVAIGHLGPLIRAFVGDGRQWGIEVEYWEEGNPLGTVGPLVAHRDQLPDDFLVMNGDILTDLPFGQLLARHRAVGGGVTVAAYTREVAIDFGVIDLAGGHGGVGVGDGGVGEGGVDAVQPVVGFREKPTLSYTVSMGVYALSRRVLERFEPGLPFGFDELLLDQLRTGSPPQAFRFDGYWLDIGRPEDYDRANEEFPVLRPTLIG